MAMTPRPMMVVLPPTATPVTRPCSAQAAASNRAAQADPVAGSLSTPTAGAKNRAYRPAPSLGSLANRYRFGDQPSARPSFHAALSSPARSTRSASARRTKQNHGPDPAAQP